VAVFLQQRGPFEDDPLLQHRTLYIERLSLHRPENGEWKILPRPAPAPPASPADETAQAQAQRIEAAVRAAQSETDGFLNAWARALSSPRQLLVRSAARASQQNIKQVLLGMMQLAQDYNETFAFTSDNFREKLLPYVKSETIFLAPVLDEEKEFAYALNPALAGKGLAQLDEPAQTVAIYEATPDGKALFRFDGKAVVGFADGHVALVAPGELNKLVWDFEPPLGRPN
jgi:prepilin-type processing-associated H-X9-DG protein